MNSEIKRLVDDDTPAAISRALITLLNSYTSKPDTVTMEYLTEDSGLALSVIQAPYIVRQYIYGGYMASYEFELIYRTMPANDSQRLQADETLNGLVTWLIQHINELNLTENIKIDKIERQNLSALVSRYQNGAEDHTSSLNLTYERIE